MPTGYESALLSGLHRKSRRKFALRANSRLAMGHENSSIYRSNGKISAHGGETGTTCELSTQARCARSASHGARWSTRASPGCRDGAQYASVAARAWISPRGRWGSALPPVGARALTAARYCRIRLNAIATGQLTREASQRKPEVVRGGAVVLVRRADRVLNPVRGPRPAEYR